MSEVTNGICSSGKKYNREIADQTIKLSHKYKETSI